MTVGKIVGFQEGIIDMQGPGAEFTPFSKTNNIVLIVEPAEGVEAHAYEKAVRMAGLKAVTYLGLAGKEVEPDEVEVFETKPLFEQAEKLKHLDLDTLFYFTESVYGIKQWIAPHRLDHVRQILWYAATDRKRGLFRCCNDCHHFQSKEI